ncbi:hypothetical protein [Amycolatopsis sp. EV170708-02-1]|uniref:hypothetical protein n=1 Tax=Amycolatopsis sp. EV170708-02-1 TaxID=2919322 RepID=UPI001F0C5928|nr:hypothetical protein [Amycolatopsis sp. EV170708-02-1]UMP07114.1 hypothetical protein MJQ72_20870 [Amycolatopsis sp. EV170708-02-1]
MCRSQPSTVRTSQSSSTGPADGWSMILRADSCRPTAPQLGDQPGRPLIGRVAGGRRTQIRDEHRFGPTGGYFDVPW